MSAARIAPASKRTGAHTPTHPHTVEPWNLVRKGGREEGREGWMQGGREGWREGGRKRGMEGGRDGGRDGWRDGGGDGEREQRAFHLHPKEKPLCGPLELEHVHARVFGVVARLFHVLELGIARKDDPVVLCHTTGLP